ncbi:MAG: hypothetical protein NT051_01745 [Candidatus Micrarchaeota archaeon]|nr:hypothetical protein [Candidatus Micrarchaeota archaeon]
MPEIYHLIPIAGTLIVLYVVSWLLSKQGKYLNVPTHRKIWNALLAVSFLATMVLSLLNVLLTNYGVRAPIDVKFWHVEFGIALVTIAIFHALWHLNYFAQYLPKEKKEAPPPSAQI